MPIIDFHIVDFLQDLPSTILKVAGFLNKPISDADVKRLAEHLHIDNFRKNTALNESDSEDLGITNPGEQPFIRRGLTTVNGWQEEYTPEIVERVELWMRTFLADTTLRFPEC